MTYRGAVLGQILVPRFIAGVAGFVNTIITPNTPASGYGGWYGATDILGPPSEGRNNAGIDSIDGLITVAGVPQSHINVQIFNTDQTALIAYRGGRTDTNGYYHFDYLIPGNYEVMVRDPNMGYRTKVIHAVVYRPVIFTDKYINQALTVGNVPPYPLSSRFGKDPVLYTVQSGALPTGVTLNTDGTWAGAAAATGSFSGVFAVTDALGNIGTQAFSFVVT